MNKNDVITKLLNILDETMDIENISIINQETNLVQEVGMSSLDAICVLVAVEEEFSIEIDDNDLSADLVLTLSNLADYIIDRIDK